MSRRAPTATWIAASLIVCLLTGLGCAGFARMQPERFDYFLTPDPDDPWSTKILGWQRRERADQRADSPAVLPSVAEGGTFAAGSTPKSAETGALSDTQSADPQRAPTARVGSLRNEYASFLTQRKRATARDFAEWVQSQAKRHYIADGPVDHWATLEETLRADGDDCDGLELLAFHGLRDLGFEETAVFRSIVYRPSDGQHHMVTLWFEDASDPWVIDPTGAMTTGMPRMSQLPEWVPLKVFSESREFSVDRGHAARGARALASTP